jgi:hypothetical protein
VLIDAGLHDGVGSDICAESCTGTIEGNAVARSAVLGAMP